MRATLAAVLLAALTAGCAGHATPLAIEPLTHPAGEIIGTRLLAGRPYGVAVSRDGVVYAAQIASTSLARGDLATMDFTDTVAVGSMPPHVVFGPDGRRAFATLQDGRGVAVVDVKTNRLVTIVPLPADGFNLAAGPDGRFVYATTDDGRLYVIDVARNIVTATLDVGRAANGLAFSRDGAMLYVSSRDAATVVAIRTRDHTIRRTYRVGGRPQRLAVAPNGRELYVANEALGLNVVNVASGEVVSLGFGTPAYGLALTPDGAQLYVLLPDAGEIRILDRATRRAIATLAIGGRPRNVTFDPAGTRAVVANERSVVFIR